MTDSDDSEHIPHAHFTDVSAQNQGMASLVELLLTHILGAQQYVLLVIGKPCQHGISSSELYARGLNHEELGKVLIDITSAHAASRLDKDGDHT